MQQKHTLPQRIRLWFTRLFLLVRGWGLGTRLEYFWLANSKWCPPHPFYISQRRWKPMREMYIPFRIVWVHLEFPLALCLVRDLREIPSLFVGVPLGCCRLVGEHVLLQPEGKEKGWRWEKRREEREYLDEMNMRKKQPLVNSHTYEKYIQ